MWRRAAPLLVIALLNGFGEAGPVFIGFTYTANSSLIGGAQYTVAPGQIVTLQVLGLKSVFAQAVVAKQVPLPTALGGISVTIEEDVREVTTPLPVPLISVAQLGGICASDPVTPDCTITSITVEIPAETLPLLYEEEWPRCQIVVSENGVESQPFSNMTNPANTHVLTACGGLAPGAPNGTCVTHGDGTVVTQKSPAKAGETVVIYAYGLGVTDPPVPSGAATPIPAPKAVNNVYVDFNFTPNAGPRYPYVDPKQGPVNTPVFAGLTPGQVGLYQVNVKLPDSFPAVPACSSKLSEFYSQVVSNLTIGVTTYLNSYGSLSDAAGPSFDAAPICVQAPSH